MSKWLFLDDFKHAKSLAIKLGFILSLLIGLLFFGFVMADYMQYSDMYLAGGNAEVINGLISIILLIIAFITGILIFLIFGFGLMIGMNILIKKDKKKKTYIYKYIKNYGTYLLSKFGVIFLGILIIYFMLIIFIGIYLIIAFLLGSIDGGILNQDYSQVLVYVKEYFLGSIYFLFFGMGIVIKLLFLIFTINYTVLIMRNSDPANGIIFFAIFFVISLIVLVFWVSNSIILFGLRELFLFLIMTYVAGTFIQKNMEIR